MGIRGERLCGRGDVCGCVTLLYEVEGSGEEGREEEEEEEKKKKRRR